MRAVRSRVSLRASHLASLLLAFAACGSPPLAQAPVAPADIAVPAAAPASPPPPAAASEEDLLLPIHANDGAWGSRRAYATIVEFGDLQCPFTARASSTVPALA